MPDSIVARIADRLDIQPEQTERLLRTLAQLIKKQSAREGRVRVPGLGVFQQTADVLSFEPDVALSEAVNHRFVGLAPVPIAQEPEAVEPRPDETTAEAPDSFIRPPLPDAPEDLEEQEAAETMAEEPAEAIEEQAIEEEPQEEAVAEEPETVKQALVEEIVEEEEMEAPEEDRAEEEPGFAEQDAEELEVPSSDAPLAGVDYNDPNNSEAAAYAQLQEESESVEEDAPSKWAPAETSWSQKDLDELLQEVGDEKSFTEEVLPPELDLPMKEAESKEDEQDEPVAVVPPTPPVDLPPPPPRKVHITGVPRRRSALPWILLFTAVIVIGAALYFMFGPPSRTSDTPPTAAQETPPPEATEPAAETPTVAPAETTAETTTPADPTTPPQQTPAEPATPSSGRIDVARGGYTLVVGSLTEQAVAEAQAERFRQRFSGESLPVDVLVSTSDGVTRYRVVVGQVETVEEAVALKNRLLANLPDGTWPTNIALITSDGS